MPLPGAPAKGDLVPLNCLLSPSVLCYLFPILNKKTVNKLLIHWWGHEHFETWKRIISLSLSWGQMVRRWILLFCNFWRLRIKPWVISPFPFLSNLTVVSGAVVSTKGSVSPVCSFGEVFWGWWADKLVISWAMVMFTLDLCMECTWEKVLICWDTFLQSTFTNFSAELSEAFFASRQEAESWHFQSGLKHLPVGP